MEIRGTGQKQQAKDYHMTCKRCVRLFFFDGNCHGKTVICPYCGAKR